MAASEEMVAGQFVFKERKDEFDAITGISKIRPMIGDLNLFDSQTHEEAVQSYQLYLSGLLRNSRWNQMLDMCQQIRRQAAHRGSQGLADFTFHFEIEALCRMKKFPRAWRKLRHLEQVAYGRNINLHAKAWRSDELDWFSQYHPHILYFVGRYRLARRLFEAFLGKMVRGSRRGSSSDVMPYVYSAMKKPRLRQQVTLQHIYNKLGIRLEEWSDWTKFVAGFDPKVLARARVKREKLLYDPHLLGRMRPDSLVTCPPKSAQS